MRLKMRYSSWMRQPRMTVSQDLANHSQPRPYCTPSPGLLESDGSLAEWTGIERRKLHLALKNTQSWNWTVPSAQEHHNTTDALLRVKADEEFCDAHRKMGNAAAAAQRKAAMSCFSIRDHIDPFLTHQAVVISLLAPWALQLSYSGLQYLTRKTYILFINIIIIIIIIICRQCGEDMESCTSSVGFGGGGSWQLLFTISELS